MKYKVGDIILNSDHGENELYDPIDVLFISRIVSILAEGVRVDDINSTLGDGYDNQMIRYKNIIAICKEDDTYESLQISNPEYFL